MDLLTVGLACRTVLWDSKLSFCRNNIYRAIVSLLVGYYDLSFLVFREFEAADASIKSVLLNGIGFLEI